MKEYQTPVALLVYFQTQTDILNESVDDWAEDEFV